MIDLHVHTIASDGLFSVPQLVEKAKNIRLKAMAITDHDTIKGIIENIKLFENPDEILLIPGIELSVDYKDIKEGIHILGYFVPYEDEKFNFFLEEMESSRQERNVKIINKLNEVGIKISLEEVQEVAQKEIVGRPHIAQCLINKKYVSTFDEAFDKYLGKNGIAFLPRRRISAKKGIELLRKFNCIVVLAHPYYIFESENVSKIEPIIREFLDYGLQGIEVFYPMMSKEFMENLLNLAQKYKLLYTGGSDYHGYKDLNIELGYGDGNLNVPDEILDNLINHAPSWWLEKLKNSYKMNVPK